MYISWDIFVSGITEITDAATSFCVFAPWFLLVCWWFAGLPGLPHHHLLHLVPGITCIFSSRENWYIGVLCYYSQFKLV